MPRLKAGNIWEVFRQGSDLDNAMFRLSEIAREVGSMADILYIDQDGNFFVETGFDYPGKGGN